MQEALGVPECSGGNVELADLLDLRGLQILSGDFFLMLVQASAPEMSDSIDLKCELRISLKKKQQTSQGGCKV